MTESTLSSNHFVKPSSQNNPLDGITLDARQVTPTLVDFDGDGDLDLFVGNEAGSISYLENVGSAVQAQFEERSGAANPFDGVVIDTGRSKPTLADLDGDGQIDTAVVGNLAGTLSYFRYEDDQFVEQTGAANPFDDLTFENENGRSAPEFVDLDGDGQLDLVVGDGNGRLSFFRNEKGRFTQQTGGDNPFEGIDVGIDSIPTFKDMDGDGDLDAIVGGATLSNGSSLNYLENTGTSSKPKFEVRLGDQNPLDGIDIESAAPTLGDLDRDGDLDAIVGDIYGQLTYLVNSPSVSISAGRRTPGEAGAVGEFVITLSKPAPEGGLTLHYQVGTTEYAALAGVDYEPLSGEITLAAGETTAVIELKPLEDKVIDPIKTVTVTLTEPPAGYVVPMGEATTFLAIADNEGDGQLAKILNEPHFKDQWHLWNTPYNQGTAGMDLNILEVWKDYSGKGVTVGIAEGAFEIDHPDLTANYNATLQVNGVIKPKGSLGSHSTAVAGLVAAAAGNGLGGVGVAHGASITSFLLPWAVDENKDENKMDGWNAQASVDVSSNSWASYPFEGVKYATSIQVATEKGRDGLGTVFVFGAGNFRKDNYSSNYSNLTNSRQTIAVAGLTADGVYASYSSLGANLLVSAFASERNTIFSTDMVGEAGYSPGDYTFIMGGTSAAAPMVSGVAALMLEANPYLGYRDVQEILAYSARWNDSDNASWLINGAQNWNGGGLHHSIDYGFGLVDALAAVRLAETWQTQRTAANEQHRSQTSALAALIPDDGGVTRLTDTLHIAKGIDLDYVEVDITINHARYEDLIVTLTSPTGVVSELVNRAPRQDVDNSIGGKFVYLPEDVDGQDFTYTFSTTANWGETGVGDWTLSVTDAKTGDTGILKEWTLNLYGDALTADNTYIYTNTYGDVKLDDSQRLRLSDGNGGYDTLNAAAVTSNLFLNLIPGSASVIAGKTLHIDTETLIEQAFGGDGDDQILGNAAANNFHGGRGDDNITGLWGDDVLLGDAGDDFLDGGEGRDWLSGGHGHDHLSGGEGHDVFALSRGQGLDIITDFKIGVDLIELLGGLSFGQLSKVEQEKGTLLKAAEQDIAWLLDVGAEDLTRTSFRTVWA